MRLQKYIIEGAAKTNDLQEAIALLRKNCNQYIKEVRGKKNVLIRWDTRPSRQQILLRRNVRKDRRPLDTPQYISEIVDKALSEKFGWKPRSEGLFCWLKKHKYVFDDIKQGYATDSGFIFPIGQYKYVYSEIYDDLYSRLDDEAKALGYGWIKAVKPEEDEADFAIEIMAFMKNAVKDYKDKGAFNSDLPTGSVELSLNAKQVYIVQQKHIPVISKVLRLNWPYEQLIQQHNIKKDNWMQSIIDYHEEY